MPTRPACRQILAARNRKRRRAVASVVCRIGLTSAVFLPVEQQQPAVQVVGQHCDLKLNAVHRPALGGMCSQPGIVVGFLDQVLGCGPLIVERHQYVDRALHVRHKDPIEILRGLEQLVLLWFFLLFSVWLLLIAQRDEPIRFPPAIRLIPELTLLIGVGLWRPFPVAPLSAPPPNAPSCAPR